ncbi:ATP-binding protein [Paenibacillus sp. FSL R10-2796]|uniref:ATP-binding protein n=1 Tax=Paenibacillus sp. FSL R10-2796 TaxID=2954663 RepID=UPI0030DBC6E4
MEVELPSRFTRESMYPFIKQILDEEMLPRDEKIIFDFRPLEFIQPVGITVLSNLIGKLQKHGSSVSFRYRKPNKKNKWCTMSYLDDSMFFKSYLNETLDSTSALRATTLPLENVVYDRSYQYLDNAMEWLALKLSLSKESLGDIKTCLKEVFNNIKDHSSENNGFIFIQQFAKKNLVTVAISDFGIGIPSSVQTKHPSLNDAEALIKAVEEGFTTKSTPRNRGAGLAFLLHNVVNNNKGDVYIHSNSGILCCNHNGEHMVISSELSEGFYPGTLLELNFRTDTIEYVKEDFSWDDY